MLDLLKLMFPLALSWSFAEGDGGGGGANGDGDGGGGDGGDGGGGGANGPDPVPYSRFQEMVKARQALEQQNAELQKQIEAAQDAGKTELEQLQTKFGKLEQELEQERKAREAEAHKRMRLEVASKHNIPAELAGRLTGETQEELEADAKTFIEFLKAPGGPGVPPAGKGGEPKPTDLSKMSPSEVREAMREGKVKLQ